MLRSHLNEKTNENSLSIFLVWFRKLCKVPVRMVLIDFRILLVEPNSTATPTSHGPFISTAYSTATWKRSTYGRTWWDPWWWRNVCTRFPSPSTSVTPTHGLCSLVLYLFWQCSWRAVLPTLFHTNLQKSTAVCSWQTLRVSVCSVSVPFWIITTTL